jgi:ribose transport system ATP-binding protein
MTELGRFFRAGRLRLGAMKRAGAATLADYRVRPRDPRVRASQLSGGNQQRVVVAKWLGRNPRLLLLHEPTQGVDVGARAEIWAFISQMAEQGCTVICATTDHDELSNHADRVAVFARGGVAAIRTGDDVNKDRISAETLVSAAPSPGGRE